MVPSMLVNTIDNNPLLKKDEEVELAKRIESGDKIARIKLTESNLRLAISIAKRYQNKGCDMDDLIQEANIGLLKAVERFDWRRKCKFSTYATWWIKQSVSRYVSSHSKEIRIPSHVKGILNRINEVTKDYVKEFGIQPTSDELSDLLGISVSVVEACLNSATATIVSLNLPIGDKSTLEDVIEDESQSNVDLRIDRKKIIDVIKLSLQDLTKREEAILRLRFGISEDPSDHVRNPMTYEELEELKRRLRKNER